MPVFNNVLAGASAQATGYTINQSLRFNDNDSAYLNRTAGTATSNDIGTFSFWTKRGNLGGGNSFFSNHSDANNRTYIGFDADTITMFGKISGSANVELLTTPVFRDPGAWYHIVIAVDVTQSSASNRVKIYVNGTQITDFGTATYPAQNTDLPLFSKTNHQVGAFFSSSIGDYYDGYFAEYYYIDGQQLTPSSFAETNSDTNQWEAIEYDGSYGDNGFYLKFQDSSALGDDSSGNTNDFTVNNLVATDQVLDSPSNNFCVLNPIDTNTSGTLSDGNLVTSGNARVTMQPASGQWYYEKDGSGVSVSGAFNPSLTSGTYNFGSSGTGGYSDGNGKGNFDNAVPSGYLAVCSDNLSASIADPTAHFDTKLYTGTGSELAVTGLNFSPDFTWIKTRQLTYNHRVFDSVRGVTKELFPNTTGAEGTEAQSLKSFDSDGFTLGTDDGVNPSSSNMVSWNWKAAASNTSVSAGSIDGTNPTYACTRRTNSDAGFSIVSYTATGGSSATVAHGLSQAPELIICKNRSATFGWATYNAVSGADFTLFLNTTAAVASDSNTFPDAPSSTIFNLGASSAANGRPSNTDSMIAYCWHSVEGYSKIGSYTGNSSADGSFVYTGFRPAFIFIKRISSAGSNSYIVDNRRIGYNSFDTSTDNGSNKYLWPDSNAAEGNGTSAKGTGIDLLSNGFKFRGNSSDYNASGNTYLYLAFAESPFKTSNAR